MSAPRLAYSQKLLCSFCGKTAGEVEKLIAGPTVLICNECVQLCQDLMNLEAEVEAARPTFTTAQEARIRDIVREEFDDDYALNNSRNHEEFLVESEVARSHRPTKERKRNGERTNE